MTIGQGGTGSGTCHTRFPVAVPRSKLAVPTGHTCHTGTLINSMEQRLSEIALELSRNAHYLPSFGA